MLTLGLTETVSWGVLYYAFGVFVEPMQAELGWSRGEIGGAFSLALIVLALAGVPVGHWLDRRGARLLMTAGSVLAVALVVLWSQVRDLLVFYLIWALMGVAWSAVLYSPAFATVTAFFRERRTEALTVVTLMAGLASTIFLPLTAYLVAALPWRDALLVLAAILAITTVLPHALVLRPPPPHDQAAEPSLDLGAALRHASFRWLVLAQVCYALGVGVAIHLVPYLGSRGYDIRTAATIAGLVGAMQVVGRLALAPLERRLPLPAVLAAVYLLQPLGIVVLLLGPAAAPYLFVVLFGAGRGADTILRNTLVARLYGARRFASIAAVLSLFVTLAQAAGPVGLGLVYDAAGSYEPGLWVVAAASLVAVGAVTWGTRTAAPASSSS